MFLISIFIKNSIPQLLLTQNRQISIYELLWKFLFDPYAYKLLNLPHDLFLCQMITDNGWNFRLLRRLIRILGGWARRDRHRGSHWRWSWGWNYIKDLRFLIWHILTHSIKELISCLSVIEVGWRVSLTFKDQSLKHWPLCCGILRWQLFFYGIWSYLFSFGQLILFNKLESPLGISHIKEAQVFILRSEIVPWAVVSMQLVDRALANNIVAILPLLAYCILQFRFLALFQILVMTLEEWLLVSENELEVWLEDLDLELLVNAMSYLSDPLPPEGLTLLICTILRLLACVQDRRPIHQP